jgi:hypothetical protein
MKWHRPSLIDNDTHRSVTNQIKNSTGTQWQQCDLFNYTKQVANSHTHTHSLSHTLTQRVVWNKREH